MTYSTMKIFFSRFVLALLLVAVALILDSFAARDGSSTRNQGRSSVGQAGKVDKNSRRMREGTIITDQVGYFREDGDGATFVLDTGWEFGALPNLSLERVVKLLKGADEPTSIRWSVTGEVTEYSSRNFLLITRAVYKSPAPPPAPDRILTP